MGGASTHPPFLTGVFVMNEQDIYSYFVIGLCILMVIILPFIVREIWLTTRETFFALLLALYGVMCAVLALMLTGVLT